MLAAEDELKIQLEGVVVVLNALNGRALYQVPTPDYGHYTHWSCKSPTLPCCGYN